MIASGDLFAPSASRRADDRTSPTDDDPLAVHDVRDADRRTHELLAEVLAQVKALRADLRAAMDPRERR